MRTPLHNRLNKSLKDIAYNYLSKFKYGNKSAFHEYIKHDAHTTLSYTNLTRLAGNDYANGNVSTYRLCRIIIASIYFNAIYNYDEIPFKSADDYEKELLGKTDSEIEAYFDNIDVALSGYSEQEEQLLREIADENAAFFAEANT